MLVDNIWPADYPGQHKGNPRYIDLTRYCAHKGFEVSKSAIGRFGVRMRMLARMRQAGVIVRDVMKDLTAEKASETQKAVAEMITAQTVEFIASKNKMTSKQISEVAKAMRDCTQVAINSDKYTREQHAANVKIAVQKIDDIGTKKNIDPEVLKKIREEVYGIMKQ